jgi:hypothetical protein
MPLFLFIFFHSLSSPKRNESSFTPLSPKYAAPSLSARRQGHIAIDPLEIKRETETEQQQHKKTKEVFFLEIFDRRL